MEDNKLAKVLVVDDEPNIVELLTVSLKFQNFEVYSANSGNEALRVAREVNPDAYILDVMMPGMDGFELLGKLRQEGLDGPVLYLTAKDGVDQRILSRLSMGLVADIQPADLELRRSILEQRLAQIAMVIGPHARS